MTFQGKICTPGHSEKRWRPGELIHRLREHDGFGGRRVAIDEGIKNDRSEVRKD